MLLIRNRTGCAAAWLICIALLGGCTSTPRPAGVSLRDRPVALDATEYHCVASRTFRNGTGPRASPGVSHVSYEEPNDGIISYNAIAEGLFAGQTEISLSLLVAEVERRNPTLQAAIATWGAASQRCPQVVALEDPVFQTMLAPGSFPSASSVQASYFLGISQKLPWRGKLALRGQIAQAQANAAGLDSEEVRLRLAEAARLTYFEYYLVHRDLELNAANRDAVGRFRETAISKFEASQVTQQDVLQADVELALLESRRIELEQNDTVAVARINVLLHREPQLRLPPPARSLRAPGDLPSVDALRQVAIEHRPELVAQAARIQAEEASVALAVKEFYPDFELMGRYDNFWTNIEQRGQVGMYMNIPLNQRRRRAAVDEALLRFQKMRAEYDAQIDSIRGDVEAGFARLMGSQKTVRLYESTIIPTAEQNVDSANAGYEAGTIDFLRLVEAERQLIGLLEKQQEAIAAYHSRRAELERVVGTPISDTTDGRGGVDIRLDE
jgi:outer membrane protein TolC